MAKRTVGVHNVLKQFRRAKKPLPHYREGVVDGLGVNSDDGIFTSSFIVWSSSFVVARMLVRSWPRLRERLIFASLTLARKALLEHLAMRESPDGSPRSFALRLGTEAPQLERLPVNAPESQAACLPLGPGI